MANNYSEEPTGFVLVVVFVFVLTYLEHIVYIEKDHGQKKHAKFRMGIYCLCVPHLPYILHL